MVDNVRLWALPDPSQVLVAPYASPPHGMTYWWISFVPLSMGQGRFSSAGSATCSICPSGTYSVASASSSCEDCAKDEDSPAGASSCTWCTAGLWWDASSSGKSGDDDDVGDGECIVCPSKGVCLGENKVPIPRDGFWSDRSDLRFVGTMYTCRRQRACRAQATSSDCWNRSSIENDVCGSDIACAEGSGGYLCGSCASGWVYTPTLERCEECNHSTSIIATAVGFLALVCLTVIVAVLWSFNLWVQTDSSAWFFDHVVSVVRRIDVPIAKVVWSTLQIIWSISWTVDVAFPEPFSDFQTFVGAIQLDVTPIRCMFSPNEAADSQFYKRVLAASVFPFGLVLIFAAGLLARCARARFDRGYVEHLLPRYAGAVLLVLYLFVPMTTLEQLRALDCETFPHNGATRLRYDTGVDCRSDGYRRFLVVNGLFIAVYQSVPLVYLALLCRVRKRLDPNPDDPIESRRLRALDPSLAPLRFLFQAGGRLGRTKRRKKRAGGAGCGVSCMRGAASNERSSQLGSLSAKFPFPFLRLPPLPLSLSLAFFLLLFSSLPWSKRKISDGTDT